MIGGSLQETISKLAQTPAQQLQAMARDPAIGYLAATELRARNQKRAAMQPPPQPPQGTVVDAEAQKAMQAEMAGIMGGIPMQPQVRGYSGGGVVGFEEGGSVNSAEVLARAGELTVQTGMPYEKAVAQARYELGLGPQRIPPTFTEAVKSLFSKPPPRGTPTPTNAFTTQSGFPGEVPGFALPPQQNGKAPPPPDAPPNAPPGVGGRSSASVGIMGGISGGGGGGGWSKMPELAQAKEYLTPEMIQTALAQQQDILTQREQNQYRAPDLAKQQADIQAQRNWLDTQNPQDPDVVVAKARLDKQIRQLENNRPNNVRQGWIEAGLGMLASQSPFFGVGIGQGGLQGTRAFRELEANDARRLDSLSGQQMQAGLAEQARKANIFNNAISMNQHREGLQEKERTGRDALLQDRGKLAMMPVEFAKLAAETDAKAGETAYRTNASRLGLGSLEVQRRSEDTDAYNAATQRGALNYRVTADKQGALDAKLEETWRKGLADVDKATEAQEKDIIVSINRFKDLGATKQIDPLVKRLQAIQLQKADMALARFAGTPALYERAKAQKAELQRQFGMQQSNGAAGTFSAPNSGVVRDGKL